MNMQQVFTEAMKEHPDFQTDPAFQWFTGKAMRDDPRRWLWRTFSQIIKEAIADPDIRDLLIRSLKTRNQTPALESWIKGQQLPSATVQIYAWWMIIQINAKKTKNQGRHQK